MSTLETVALLRTDVLFFIELSPPWAAVRFGELKEEVEDDALELVEPSTRSSTGSSPRPRPRATGASGPSPDEDP